MHIWPEKKIFLQSADWIKTSPAAVVHKAATWRRPVASLDTSSQMGQCGRSWNTRQDHLLCLALTRSRLVWAARTICYIKKKTTLCESSNPQQGIAQWLCQRAASLSGQENRTTRMENTLFSVKQKLSHPVHWKVEPSSASVRSGAHSMKVVCSILDLRPLTGSEWVLRLLPTNAINNDQAKTLCFVSVLLIELDSPEQSAGSWFKTVLCHRELWTVCTSVRQCEWLFVFVYTSTRPCGQRLVWGVSLPSCDSWKRQQRTPNAGAMRIEDDRTD